MMHFDLGNDIRFHYRDMINCIIEYGQRSAPRGMPIYELIGSSYSIDAYGYTMPTDIGRKLNPAIGAGEALQIIGGAQYPALMQKIAPNFARFTNGEVFHGSYGERLVDQIPRIRERLMQDTDSRQCVASIWDPVRDLWATDRRDLPCTTQIQWFIRDHKLEQVVTMRSNDIWWGVAYDLFQFTQLQINLAESLSLRAGRCHVQAGSIHLYERDVLDAESVQYSPETLRVPDVAPQYANPLLPYGEWETIRGVADSLLRDARITPIAVGGSSNAALEWYARKLYDATA